jgi:HSP20 family protein
MKIDDFGRSVGAMRESLAEGWERLRQRASSALTRFRPSRRSAPDDAVAELPDDAPLWTMLGGDVYEDERRVIVKLEAPGLERDDFDIEVIGNTLVVRGEKRFQRESSEGRWRVVQCAYGSFQRSVPLPAAVKSAEAVASYRRGVLRVELPKREKRVPQSRLVPVR